MIFHAGFDGFVTDVDAIDVLDEFSHHVLLVVSARKVVLDVKNDLVTFMAPTDPGNHQTFTFPFDHPLPWKDRDGRYKQD